MTLLGIDLGSSSVKVCLVDAESGRCLASAFAPKQEAPIMAARPGWAEQDPLDWWAYLTAATSEVVAKAVSDGTVRFGNIRTRLGVTVSGEAGKNVPEGKKYYLKTK